MALAGLQPARLAVVLTPTLPRAVSPNAEAWTIYDETCKGDRIFLYTRSGVFRCASDEQPLQHQCLLKLASVIVHESWHLEHGPDEAAAYTAQLLFLQMIEASAFLQLNEAAATEMAAIRRARSRVLADKRHAGKTGSKSSTQPACQSLTVYSRK